MKEITEDYCEFETAKLLKEKRFYGECLSMYLTPKPHCGMGNPNEPKIAPHGRDSHYYEGYLYQCEAPTHQMVIKWLREVHNICISVDVKIGGGKYYVCISSTENGLSYEVFDFKVWDTFEEACEAAIKYVLENLI